MPNDKYPLPTTQEDARLNQGWYHTIELPGGLTTNGVYDLRPVVKHYHLPETLTGMSALDVGSADGFWAFELEQRGAAPVVAIDVDRWGDFDLTPPVRKLRSDGLERDMALNFLTASSWRNSKVTRTSCNVYDASPERLGTFDLVFCGALLLHLMAPLRALSNSTLDHEESCCHRNHHRRHARRRFSRETLDSLRGPRSRTFSRLRGVLLAVQHSFAGGDAHLCRFLQCRKGRTLQDAIPNSSCSRRSRLDTCRCPRLPLI